MGRIMAIDYGRKRVGVAVSDPLRIIASPLTTVAASGIMAFIKDYIASNDVELIVVGLPLQNSGEHSESFKYVRPFVDRLKKEVAVPIVYHDERFTTVLAKRAIIEGGVKKAERRDKSLADKISASLILQSYMELDTNNR